MDKRAKPVARKAAAKSGSRPEARPIGQPVSLAAGAESPWKVPVAVDKVPDDGLHRDIAASESECAQIAKLADARTVSAVGATLDLHRDGALIQVTGRVRAKVGQTCVVTLEPIETEVDEPIDVTFATVTEDAAPPRGPSEDDPPEPLAGGTLDLGAIATEFLLLGLDPYPRKQGVEFTPPDVADDVPHPFAALAALKKPPGGGSP